MPKFTEEQQRAIDLEGENILVSAGAGSGKTAVLSERVLRKVMGGVPVNQLLILTFTKKAASEMKERIRKKLRKANLTHQLELLDSSFITTFDAYSMAIVKKYADNLNISSNLEVMDDVILSLKEDEIIDEIFKEYYDKKDINFYKFLDAFTFKDDKEIKTKIKKMVASLDLVLDLDDYLDSYLDNYYQEENLNGYLKEYLKLIMEKDNYLKKLINDFLGMIDDKYYNKVIDITSNYLASNDYSEIREGLNFKIPNLPKGSEEDVKNLKKEINSKQAELLDLMVYPKEEDYITSLKNTYPYVSMLLEIIKKLRARIWEYKTKENAYTFLDIEKLAIKLVKEFEEVREELKNSYQEILIDEYQDTNDIQETFISYIAKNNVYMVGDIKQSIYRFRNANPMLFQEKYDNYKVHNGGTVIDLSKNFRSRREVINTINDLFCHIMDQEIGGANYLDGHAMIFGNLTYENKAYVEDNCDMEILSYSTEDKEYETREKEAFLIASDIKKQIASKRLVFDKDKEILREVDYQDIAILLDRSTDFTLYKQIFEYLGIPITLWQSENAKAAYDLEIVKNLFLLGKKIYLHEFDTTFKLVYTSLARSFLYSMEDALIYHDLMDNKYQESKLYQDFKELVSDYEILSPITYFNKILEITDYTNKLTKIGTVATYRARIEYFYKMISNLEKKNKTLLEVTDYLESLCDTDLEVKLSLSKSDSNSVKVMTIHTSKGLEYPLCYFAGFSKKFNDSDNKETVFFDRNYGIVIPDIEKTCDLITKKLVVAKNRQEDISEKIRLFYVALTRAREKIIIVMPEQEEVKEVEDIVAKEERLNYHSFMDMMKSVLLKFSNNITNIKEIENISKDYLNRKEIVKEAKGEMKPLLFIDSNYSLEEEETLHFSKETVEKKTIKEIELMEYGSHIHELLERCDIENKALPTNITLKEEKLLNDFLNQEFFKIHNNMKIYKEYEFFDYENNTRLHGKIDLLLVGNDNAIIVDYKLQNTRDKAYLKQLNGYKKVIEKKLSIPVTCYLYSIIDEKFIKII